MLTPIGFGDEFSEAVVRAHNAGAEAPGLIGPLQRADRLPFPSTQIGP